MPDQTVVTPLETKTGESPTVPETKKPEVTAAISQLISCCAAGLLACFFLPWTYFLGEGISGFKLQQMDVNQKALWAIPLFCAITIFAGIKKQGQRTAAQITGVVPFLALIFWLNQLGMDLLKSLAPAGYATLALGLAVLILPRTGK